MTSPNAAFAALLAKARAQIAEKKAKPRNHLLDSADRYEHEWNEVYIREAYVARYWHQQCLSCGCTQTGLEGIYEQRRHPRLSDRVTRRLTVEQIRNLEPLPRTQVVRTEQVPACLFCANKLLFPTDQLPELINAQTSLAEPEDAPACDAGARDVR